MGEFRQGPVGVEAEQAISKLQNFEDEPAVGNVLRRLCQFAGEGACKQTCQLRELRGIAAADAGDTMAEAFAERSCADLNLLHAFNELELEPSDVLMVGVTANEVGFGDELDNYEKLVDSPYGWRELPGFNAFFAREGEEKALGRRLADCADINFEFQDRNGDTVFGFEHGTRTNMFGSSEYHFENSDGEKVSFTEYIMEQAIKHYGADPDTMRIKLAAAINGGNNTYTFDSVEKMETVLPGWQAAGFSRNVSKPDWAPGDPVAPGDEWDADTRGMIIHDIEEAMARLGVPAENFDKSDILDPNESNGVHSSNKTSYRTGANDSRDLYITYLTKWRKS